MPFPRRDIVPWILTLASLAALYSAPSSVFAQTERSAREDPNEPATSNPGAYRSAADRPSTRDLRLATVGGGAIGLVGGSAALITTAYFGAPLFLSSSASRAERESARTTSMYAAGAVGLLILPGVGSTIGGNAVGGRGKLGYAILGSTIGGAVPLGVSLGTGLIVTAATPGDGFADALAGALVAVIMAGATVPPLAVFGGVKGYQWSAPPRPSGAHGVSVRPTVAPTFRGGSPGGQLGLSIRF